MISSSVKRNPNMFRCKLAKMVGDHVVYVTYFGPFDAIPKGWSICFKAVARSGVAA